MAMGQPKQPRKNVNKQLDQFNGFYFKISLPERERGNERATVREYIMGEQRAEPHLFCARATTRLLSLALSRARCAHYFGLQCALTSFRFPSAWAAL